MTDETGVAPREALNGIGAAQRAELSGRMRDDTQVSRFSGPWSVRSQWRGGFRVDATARGHVIEFDEPADLTAQDSAPTPHEHLLSAVAACVTDGVVLHATLAGVAIDDLQVTVTASFDNILRWAGLAAEGNPGFGALEITGDIRSAADEATLTDLWNRAISGSPVAQTVTRPTSLVTRLRIG